MQIGIILTKTPSEIGFSTFLRFASIYSGKEELSIYCVGNGVFSARKGHLKENEIKKLLENSSIYAYLDDLKARGIAEEDLIERIELIDNYDKLVIDVMENKDQVLSF